MAKESANSCKEEGGEALSSAQPRTDSVRSVHASAFNSCDLCWLLHLVACVLDSLGVAGLTAQRGDTWKGQAMIEG